MGRKKMKTSEKVDIRLRLDADLAEKIQAEAESEGATVAGLIRQTMIKELKRRAKEAGDKP